MVRELEADYLVVGAGAAGMAFVDSLITECDADVIVVDREEHPGGHWNHAYPFVRLHQPSAFYGVNSMPLGDDSIDVAGPNAGFYERASGDEICGYFRRVLDEALLPSGRVRFLGRHDYHGDWHDDHVVESLTSGATTPVRVRRRVVDTTYLECSVPVTHARPFTVDGDARVIAVNDLPAVVNAARTYTILGAGKTAMDACCWLLDQGVDADRLRWVRPRDSWVMDRAYFQPLELVATTIEGLSLSVEALAEAGSITEFLRRVDDTGMFVRLDPRIEPTMFRGAITSQRERDALGQIERVIRHGRVRHVGADRIVLDDGDVSTSRAEVHVDCTAYGLGSAPTRPTFEPGRITIQSAGQTTPAAALAAYVEANRDDDRDKNRLCPPTITPTRPSDWVVMLSGILRTLAAHAAEPDLHRWRTTSRLNPMRGLGEHMTDGRVQAAMARWATHQELALKNAEALAGGAPRGQHPRA